MTYQAGKMGIAEGLSLVFFVTFVPNFQSIYSISVDQAKNAAWLLPIVTGSVAAVMVTLLVWVMKWHGLDLLEASEDLLGRKGVWLVGLFYTLQFFTEGVFLVREFAENTLLTALPNAEFAATVTFYVGIASLVLFFGIEPLARVSYLLVPFVLLAVVLAIFFSRSKLIIYQLAPWQGPGLSQLLQMGVAVSGVNCGVFLLTFLGRSFQNIATISKAISYGFGLSMFIRIVMFLSFVMIFGEMVGREKVLPFFEITRVAYTSRYLQHIEALFILVWVIAGLIGMALCFYVSLYILVRLFRLPTMLPLILPAAISAAQLAMLPGDITMTIELHHRLMTTVYQVGVIGIPALLFIVALFKRRRRKRCSPVRSA